MDRRSTPWLLAGLAVLLTLVAGALAQAVAAGGLESQDRLIGDTAYSLARDHAWVVTVTKFFAVMGSWIVLVPVTVAVVVMLARRGHPWWAAWVGMCGMGGWIISQTVKQFVDRPRPIWTDPIEVLSSPSFPSGHSMAGVYAYVVFGIVALALLDRRWPGIVLIVFGILMGPSRVLLGVHWSTDVLAGWLLAGAWISGCAAGLLLVRESRSERTPQPADIPA